MNKHILDLTNKKIGRLTVLSLSDQRTPSGKISAFLHGKRKQVKGLHFVFVEIPEGMSDMEVETR